MKIRNLYVLLILLLFVSCVLSLFTGTVKLSNLDGFVFLNIRLPRTLGALFTGAGLACCGLIFQTIFRNPVSDSYVMGISSAASCAIAFASAMKISFSGSTSLFAFTGSTICCVILYLTCKNNPFRMLLCGIAANFLLSALSTLFIYLSKSNVNSILFWTMGSLDSFNIPRVIILAISDVILLFTCMKNSNGLDLLLTDDSTALSSGLDINRLRMIMILIACISTSLTVSFCGIIGFVGLMCPHLIRLITGPKHKHLIVLSMLAGSNLMLFTDIVSRTVISPAVLPVGIVTSIIGAPVFFVISKRNNLWQQG